MRDVVLVLLLSSILDLDLVESQLPTTEDIPYTTATDTFDAQIYSIAASHNFHPESVNSSLPIPDIGTVAWWAQSGSEGYEGVGVAFTNAFINQTEQQVIYESALSVLVYKCWTYDDTFIIPMFQVMGTDNILVNAHIAYMINVQNRIQWKRIGIKASQNASTRTSFTALSKIFSENEGELFIVPTSNPTAAPTVNPTSSPTTSVPTLNPTSSPTTSVSSTYTQTLSTKWSNEAAVDNDQATTLSVTSDMDRVGADFLDVYGWIIIVVIAVLVVFFVCVVVTIWYYCKRKTREKTESHMCGSELSENADVPKNELQSDNGLVEYVNTIKQPLDVELNANDSHGIVEHVNTMNIEQDFEVSEDEVTTPKGNTTTKKTYDFQYDDNVTVEGAQTPAITQ